jgi:hypothetical protein
LLHSRIWLDIAHHDYTIPTFFKRHDGAGDYENGDADPEDGEDVSGRAGRV